jgi:Tol biopolymer transport system component
MWLFRTACAVIFALWFIDCQSAEIAAPRLATTALTNLVGQSPAGGTSLPVVSADGTRAVFVSRAPNLLTNSRNGSYQVFVRDLTSGSIVLVSANGLNAGGNDHSTLPSVSSNGLWIAFESEASDLVSNDTNGVVDVFVRDVAGGETILVSGGNGPSRSPIISADGRYVAFESRSSDLAAGDVNQTWDVFIRDVVQGTTAPASVNMDGSGTGNRGSELLTMTPDGRFIAFWSDATNISAEVTNTIGEVYVRDTQANVTYCLTKAIQVYPGVRRFKTVLTPDARFAALHELNDPGPPSQPAPAGAGRIYWVDVFGGSVTNVAWGRPARGLAISDDGSRMLFYARDRLNRDGLFLGDMSISTNQLLLTNLLDIGSFQVSGDFQRLWYTLMITNRGYQLFEYDFATGGTNLISTNSVGLAINGGVFSPFSVSDAGGVLAFETAASDVVPNDLNQAPDVFVVGSGLLAPRHRDLPEWAGRGFGTVWRGNVSANGQRVSFVSTDSTLVAHDTNGYQDVFIMDLKSNQVVNLQGVLRSNSPLAMVLSADGLSVVFERFAGLQGVGRRGDLFRADLRTDQSQQLGAAAFNVSSWRPSVTQNGRWITYQDGSRIRLTDFRTPAVPGQASNQVVDVRYDSTAQGNGNSSNPAISLDGDWVVFLSRATDLVNPDEDGGTGTAYPSGVSQVFARNVRERRTRLVSITDSGSPLPTGATNPALSANAQFTIFETLTTSNVYRHDLYARGRVTNALVCSGCSQPSISADGRLVTYQRQGQIYVKDLQNAANELIGGTGATEPTISFDGRFVVFVSRETVVSQIYLRDRWNGTTDLISRDYLGSGPANAPSSRPVMSHDGRTIAFQSFASDLVPGDYNGRRDIFVVQIAAMDSDGDGLDDDWERFYFGNLAVDGAGNSDGDHLTDGQEFLAGTNPLDPSSALRFTGIASQTRPGPVQDTEVRWLSAAGKTYRVEHKVDLASPWSALPGEIITGGPNGSTTHLSADGTGFYRVVLVE